MNVTWQKKCLNLEQKEKYAKNVLKKMFRIETYPDFPIPLIMVYFC